MCGPHLEQRRRRRFYQIREFQMASSADELESEDPDDELELDDPVAPAQSSQDADASSDPYTQLISFSDPPPSSSSFSSRTCV